MQRQRLSAIRCLVILQAVWVHFLIAEPSKAQFLEFTSNSVSHSDGSTATFAEAETPYGPGVEVAFNLVAGGWANLSAPLRDSTDKRPVTFLFTVTSPCTLELKFAMADGSTFGQSVAVEPAEFCRARQHADQPRNDQYPRPNVNVHGTTPQRYSTSSRKA